MKDKSIFRKVALERLSSPEQLDRLMTVTSPRGWIALGGFCLIVFFALLWSIFGRIPTTIEGTGILMSSGGIREVEVVGAGVVSDVRVEVGDSVARGDLMAVVGQPQLEQQVAQARDRVALLEEELRKRENFTSRNTALEIRTLERERDDALRQLEAVRERISWLEGRLEAQREARDLGLITPDVVQETVQELETARGELTGLELQLQNNDLRRLLIENRAEESVEEVEERLRRARRELQALELDLEQTSRVVSPYTGYVREIRTDVGQMVTAGQALASIEMAGAPLQAVVFVPTEGKRIQAGMNAQVSPVTVKREEYGYMLGRVEFVSNQPATPQGMRRTLGNEILVEQLARQGAPFLVEVDLTEDSATTSGFRWSSPQGPPLRVESGTICTVRVVVEEERPISLVLPIFRSALGLSA